VTVHRRYPAAPLVGVAAAVFNRDGEVLLVKRGRPPRQGSWGLSGGLLDLGERLADGARREVREECGIDIEVVDIIATFEPVMRDEVGRVEYHYVVIDFWAHYLSGEATPQDDVDAVAWVAMDQLDRFDLLAESRDVVELAYRQWQQSSVKAP
jgi:8-oxo-dGTP diphosphatase